MYVGGLECKCVRWVMDEKERQQTDISTDTIYTQTLTESSIKLDSKRYSDCKTSDPDSNLAHLIFRQRIM